MSTVIYVHVWPLYFVLFLSMHNAYVVLSKVFTQMHKLFLSRFNKNVIDFVQRQWVYSHTHEKFCFLFIVCFCFRWLFKLKWQKRFHSLSLVAHTLSVNCIPYMRLIFLTICQITIQPKSPIDHCRRVHSPNIRCECEKKVEEMYYN